MKGACLVIAENNQKKAPSFLSQAASAAHAAKGALKTSKTLAGTAKGAAAGPYELIGVGLWENRKVILMILTALSFLLLLPTLFILMLPSLIFGSNGLNDVAENVLNDNSVIMSNIAKTEVSIEKILRENHDAKLETIQAEIDALGANAEYGITDDFADRIIYESTLIISQSCASLADYREINLTNLKHTPGKNSCHFQLLRGKKQLGRKG